tara:strand:+ start:183 stop:662 length:480 start_codon:yes stop_codon:yes gene_type:complete
MPNWCSNEVEIDGTEEDIAKFVDECFTDFKTARGKMKAESVKVLDFDKVLPEPDYDKPKKDGTHNDGVQTELSDKMPDWWNWRNTHWGTKWNLVPSKGGGLYTYDADLTQPDFIRLEFDTAWNPPNGIYEAIVEKYPSLDINWFYREDGTQLVGWLPYG